jgi:hypothetical protein
MMDKVPKKMNVSVNFLGALFSLLDFLNLEAGTARLSQNAAQYLRRAHISNDMVPQPLFGSTWSSSE